MTNEHTLSAHHLIKTYGTAPHTTTALAGVDLSIAPGESVAIMGPSGSGKTTLLHCLAGVLTPTTGQVIWAGRSLGSMPDGERTQLRRSDFGFVFQSGQLLPELPAEENVALPLLLAGHPRPLCTERARQWLGYLGLAGMEQRRPGELSGGQAQRVAIARALVAAPGVIFADEPTGALDQQTGHEVLGVLTHAAQQTGAALVVVTHDPAVAAWCSRTVHMRDGALVPDPSGTLVPDPAGALVPNPAGTPMPATAPNHGRSPDLARSPDRDTGPGPGGAPHSGAAAGIRHTVSTTAGAEAWPAAASSSSASSPEGRMR